MSDQSENHQEGSGFWGRLVGSPAFKFVFIGFIVLLLMIPQFMVWGMVMEREGNARSVRAEVARSWGIEQNVKGPFLVIPIVEKNIVVTEWQAGGTAGGALGDLFNRTILISKARSNRKCCIAPSMTRRFIMLI